MLFFRRFSDQAVRLEGSHYFQPRWLRREYFSVGQAVTTCPWKGMASYRDATVDGAVNRDAAWCYP